MSNTLNLDSAAARSNLYFVLDDLCASQDSALMQILSMATLARVVLDGDIKDAIDHAGQILDAIKRIAAAANKDLDAVQIEIEDSRFRDSEVGGQFAGAASPAAPLQTI